jgi:hypothetical protein
MRAVPVHLPVVSLPTLKSKAILTLRYLWLLGFAVAAAANP